MQTVTTVGLDIAKSIFQVHGVDAQGRFSFAASSSAVTSWRSSRSCHRAWWASRPVRHPTIGHVNSRRSAIPCGSCRRPTLKPYVKRQKNDAADAEAICEAVTRANMRFVETKTPEQQSGLVLHRTRHLFIRQQTAVINAIRSHLGEFGIVAPVGRNGVEDLLNVVADPSDKRVPEIARACLVALGT